MKTIKPNMLETILLKPMSEALKTPMDRSQIETFIVLSMIDSHDEMYEEMLKKIWSLEAIEKRTKICLTISIDKATLMWITILNKGRIGNMIMYIYYLQYWAKLNNVKTITFDMLAIDIFPMGFIANEQLHTLWAAQKCNPKEYGGTDNLIDYPQASELIQYYD